MILVDNNDKVKTDRISISCASVNNSPHYVVVFGFT
jgi:hypothetical protein